MLDLIVTTPSKKLFTLISIIGRLQACLIPAQYKVCLRGLFSIDNNIPWFAVFADMGRHIVRKQQYQNRAKSCAPLHQSNGVYLYFVLKKQCGFQKTTKHSMYQMYPFPVQGMTLQVQNQCYLQNYTGIPFIEKSFRLPFLYSTSSY